MDILDALSFRLMVLDHIKKKSNAAVVGMEDSEEENEKDDFDNIEGDVIDEKEIKIKLEKEVNKLIFQK